MKKNVIIANKDFKYFVIEDNKLIFETKNVMELKKYIKEKYNRDLREFKFNNSYLEKIKKQHF